VVADLERAERAAAESDLFLAIGSSLTVYPVAWLPERALSSGARLVIINAEPTALDDRAHAVLRGRIGEILPALLERAAAQPA
jgi:NAD-dependent deacetylase